MEKNEHSCEKEKCDGRAIEGLYMKCIRCEKKSYLQCLQYNTDGLKLLETIQLLKYNRTTKSWDPNVTNETKGTFETIFGQNTSFEYTCKICLKSGTTNKILRNLVHKINEQENAIKLKSEKVDEMKKKMKEKEEEIQELTHRCNVMNLTDDETSDKTNKTNDENQLQIKISQIITAEMKKINENVKNECTKLKDMIMQHVTHKENNNINSNNKKENTKKTKQTTIDRMFAPKVTFDSSIEIDTTPIPTRTNEKRQSPIQISEHTINNTQFDKTLKPPQVQTQTNGNDTNTTAFHMNLRPAMKSQHRETNMHAIYVGKFEYGTTRDKIEEHIMNNTSAITNEGFEIEQITSSKFEKPNYVAFKISTLKYELYNEIMKIWAPHFVAREYKTKQTNNETQGEQHKYRWSQGDQLKYRSTQKRTDRFETRNIYNSTPRRNTDNRYKQMRNEHMQENRQSRYAATPQRNGRNEYKMITTPKNKNYENNNKQEKQQIIYMPYPQYTQPMQYQTYTYQPIQPQTNFLGQYNRMHAPPPTQNQIQQQQNV